MRAHCRSKFTVPAQQYTLRASHALSSALECDVCHERCHLLTTSPTFADDSPLHILDKTGCLGLHVHDRPSWHFACYGLRLRYSCMHWECCILEQRRSTEQRQATLYHAYWPCSSGLIWSGTWCWGCYAQDASTTAWWWPYLTAQCNAAVYLRLYTDTSRYDWPGGRSDSRTHKSLMFFFPKEHPSADKRWHIVNSSSSYWCGNVKFSILHFSAAPQAARRHWALILSEEFLLLQGKIWRQTCQYRVSQGRSGPQVKS